jgi:hypothetical protein
VYLVVTATPGTVHHYAFLDGYPKNYRYPYEFAVAGVALTTSGPAVTAKNVDWNGSLAANATATFGFLANSGAANTIPAVAC